MQYGGFDRRFQFVLLYYMLENVVKAMLIKSKSTAFPVADPKGSARKFFHYHGVIGKHLSNNTLAPPLWEILDPAPIPTCLTHKGFTKKERQDKILHTKLYSYGK